MIEKMLQTLLGELQKISRAETVVGQAITCGDCVIIPISKVNIGFGAGTTGGGAADQELSKDSRMKAAGTGGGIRVEPVACVVVDKTGRAQLLQLSNPTSSTVGKVIDLVPEVMDRLGLTRDDEKKPKEKSKKDSDD